MRQCSSCGEHKEIALFPKRGGVCKKCQSNRSTVRAIVYASENNPKYKFYRSKAYVKRNGLPFKLTFEQYASEIAKPCYYCDEKITGHGISLDRIDNDRSIGYVIGNILPCCTRCNRMRGAHFTVEEAKIAIQAVLDFRKLKTCDRDSHVASSHGKNLEHGKTQKAGDL